ncbi:MAG: hypothetical protein M1522_01855, partial [Actinobacteria bacterium]|nr:hypothetical protein [Actinomycetota bacterium]
MSATFPGIPAGSLAKGIGGRPESVLWYMLNWPRRLGGVPRLGYHVSLLTSKEMSAQGPSLMFIIVMPLAVEKNGTLFPLRSIPTGQNGGRYTLKLAKLCAAVGSKQVPEVVSVSVEFRRWSSAPGAAVRQARGNTNRTETEDHQPCQ